MIEVMAERIAKMIKKANPEETKSVPVMAYSLSILINSFAVIIVSLIIGVLNGRTTETFLALISFATLRMVSGGHHARSLTVCFVVSTALFVLIPYIPLTKTQVTIANILALSLVAVFAPYNGEKNNIPQRVFPLFKAISITLVVTSLLIGHASIALSLLAQALLLIPLSGRR